MDTGSIRQFGSSETYWRSKFGGQVQISNHLDKLTVRKQKRQREWVPGSQGNQCWELLRKKPHIWERDLGPSPGWIPRTAWLRLCLPSPGWLWASRSQRNPRMPCFSAYGGDAEELWGLVRWKQASQLGDAQIHYSTPISAWFRSWT